MAKPKPVSQDRSAGANVSALLTLHPRGRTKAKSLPIPMEGEAFDALSSDKASIKAIAEAVGDMLARSRKGERVTGFAVVMNPDGHPAITDLPPSQATVEDGAKGLGDEGAGREQAFAAARARGRIMAAEILSRADMLSADELAERLGISRVTVNARRQRHELLGLDGAKRGFRFPDWQVDEDGQPIEILPQLFERVGPSPWSVYRFLTQRHDVLGGATAVEALRRGQADKVLDAAVSLGRGDFS